MTEKSNGPGRRLRRFVISLLVPGRDVDEVMADFDDTTDRYGARVGAAKRHRRLVRELLAFAAAAIAQRATDAGAACRSEVAGLVSESRQTLRSFVRHPLVPILVVVTLGLGIGGSTAIFAVTDQAVLRPLPFHEPDRLFALRSSYQGDSWWSISTAEGIALSRSSLLEGIGWSQDGTVTSLEAGTPVHRNVLRVSSGLLPTLGVSPRLGRLFDPGDDESGVEPRVLLTEAYWQSRFARDPSVIGTSVVLDGAPHVILAVLPADSPLDFLAEHSLVLPFVLAPDAETSFGRVLQAVVRAQPGVSSRALGEELSDRIAELGAGSLVEGWTINAVPLKDEIVQNIKTALWILMAAILCLLVVTCFNVGSLFLARGAARQDELRVRLALGAKPRRIVRQLLLDALLLSSFGALFGAGLGYLALDAFSGLAIDLLPVGLAPTVDLRAVGFAGGLALLTGLAFGMAPALAAVRTTTSALVTGVRSTSIGRSEGRTSALIVAAEVACVVVLVSGAVLMGLGFQRLGGEDPGFDMAPVVVLELALPADRFGTVEEQTRLSETLVPALTQLPGVAAAGAVSNEPFGGNGWTAFHVVDGGAGLAPGEEPTGGIEMASEGYFAALGLPVIEGRVFERLELLDSAAVGVVNDTLAQRYWPGESPLGRSIRYGPAGSEMEVTVVGVVGSARYSFGVPARPRLYLPERRIFGAQPTLTMVIRLDTGQAATSFEDFRGVVRRVAPEAAIAALGYMSDNARQSLAGARFQAVLLGVFGGVGLLLGFVGVYGVVAHAVGRRRSEVSVRLTLGASRGDVLRRMLLRALAPALAGVVPGVLVTLALGRWLQSRVEAVDAADPGIVASIGVAMLVMAALAALPPALRASRIDPAASLRNP